MVARPLSLRVLSSLLLDSSLVSVCDRFSTEFPLIRLQEEFI